jgi:hypothetical protein
MPAIRVGKALVSKSSISEIPELPSQTFFQASSSRLPTGDTMPIPVITTRRLLKGISAYFRQDCQSEYGKEERGASRRALVVTLRSGAR